MNCHLKSKQTKHHTKNTLNAIGLKFLEHQREKIMYVTQYYSHVCHFLKLYHEHTFI